MLIQFYPIFKGPDKAIEVGKEAVANGIKGPFLLQIANLMANKGDFDDFRPDSEFMNDEQKLLRLHRIAMDDHLLERATTIKKSQGDSLVIVSNGNIYEISKEDSGRTLDRIMSNRYYYEYNDLARPIVKVSKDGTLGWVIAQIQAKGVRLNENKDITGPLKFTCSWVMMYEKVNGEWKSIGNASTFGDDYQ